MTYEMLESRLVAWAETQSAVRAILLIGSWARGEADRWSDLDTIVFTTDADRYAADSGWLHEFGTVWLTALEKTDGGHREWYALYEGGLKLDAVLIPVEDAALDLDGMLASFPYQGVLSRGYRVIFDSSGAPSEVVTRPLTPPAPPTQDAFEHLTNGFLMDALTAAKHIRRGHLWRVQRHLAVYSRPSLLTMIEWHAHGRDTWYGGRYIEDWADPRVMDALPQTFPTYDQTSMKTALLEMLALFRWMGEETAARFGFVYPAAAHDNVGALVASILEGESP